MSDASFSKWLLEQVPAIVISMGFIYYLIGTVKRYEKLLENERDYARTRDNQDRELISKLTVLIEDIKDQTNSCNIQIIDKIAYIANDIKTHISLTASKKDT